MRLRDISVEIISLLPRDPDVKDQETLDVSTDFPTGPKDHVQCSFSENATNLGFTTKEWE